MSAEWEDARAREAEVQPSTVSLEAALSGSWPLWPLCFCFCSHMRPWEPWEMKFGCLSFGQLYVSIILNSVKTLETWWWPVLCGHWHCTLAVHITHWDWENSLVGDAGAEAGDDTLPDAGLAAGLGQVRLQIDCRQVTPCPALPARPQCCPGSQQSCACFLLNQFVGRVGLRFFQRSSEDPLAGR